MYNINLKKELFFLIENAIYIFIYLLLNNKQYSIINLF